jgi:hypothetical protein
MNQNRNQIRRLAASAAGLAALLLTGNSPAAEQEQAREYEIKAAFIYNFVQFTEWPKTAFEEDTSPLVIGVLGNDAIAAVLTRVIGSKKIGPHPIHVLSLHNVEEIDRLHALYVMSEDDQLARDAVLKLADRFALTISGNNSFMPMGGMIRLYAEDRRMRFEVSLNAAQRAKLKISSKLLKLAKIYDK